MSAGAATTQPPRFDQSTGKRMPPVAKPPRKQAVPQQTYDPFSSAKQYLKAGSAGGDGCGPTRLNQIPQTLKITKITGN